MRIRKRKSNGKKEITLYCYVRSYAFAYLLIDTEKRSRFLPVSCREPFYSDHMKKRRCTSSLSLLQFMKSIPYRFTLCISPSEIYVFSNAVTLSINLDVPIYECRVTKVDQHKIAVFVTKSDFLEKKTRQLPLTEPISSFPLFQFSEWRLAAQLQLNLWISFTSLSWRLLDCDWLLSRDAKIKLGIPLWTSPGLTICEWCIEYR